MFSIHQKQLLVDSVNEKIKARGAIRQEFKKAGYWGEYEETLYQKEMKQLHEIKIILHKPE